MVFQTGRRLLLLLKALPHRRLCQQEYSPARVSEDCTTLQTESSLEVAMRCLNVDLHRNAPDTSAVTLLLMDVIRDLEFDTGPQLSATAMEMAKHLSALKKSAVAVSVPLIYVNDNFHRWRHDFQPQVDHCLTDGGKNRKQ